MNFSKSEGGAGGDVDILKKEKEEIFSRLDITVIVVSPM